MSSNFITTVGYYPEISYNYCRLCLETNTTSVVRLKVIERKYGIWIYSSDYALDRFRNIERSIKYVYVYAESPCRFYVPTTGILSEQESNVTNKTEENKLSIHIIKETFFYHI